VNYFTLIASIPAPNSSAAARSTPVPAPDSAAVIMGDIYMDSDTLFAAWSSISRTAALPSLTLLGCAVAYIYADQKGIRSARAFLEKCFPQKTEWFYYRVDFLLTAMIGTAVGTALYAPLSTHQAIAAGVGWTAIFSIATVPRAVSHGRLRKPVTPDSNAAASSLGMPQGAP
jgi:hypothetical protein